AERIYAQGAWGLRTLVPEVARVKMALSPIRFGLALIEDGYDQTCQIVGLRAEQIAEREPDLLRRAKEVMAGLPFDEVDLLIVDRIGKEISGAGMDTNVIGRKRIDREPEEGRGLRIRDTLHLEHVWISEAFLPEAREHPRLEVKDEPRPLAFDGAGSLV